MEPIRIVSQDLTLPVTVISPDLTVNGTVRNVATVALPLDVKLLKHCLYPDQSVNADVVRVSKPVQWN